MFNPPHPGEILKDLWLEPLGLSITYTAKHLNVSRKTLSEIINGKSSISSEMAARLEMAFGKSAQSWLAHQAEYDLWQIKIKNDDLGVKRVEVAGFTYAA